MLNSAVTNYIRSPKTAFYIRRAIWIIIAWVLIANLQFLYEYLLLKENGVVIDAESSRLKFKSNLIISIAAAVIGGFFTVNLMEKWLRNNPYWLALVYIISAFTLVAFLIAWVGISYLISQELELPFFSEIVRQEVNLYLFSINFFKNYFFWLFIVLGTVITLMVNDKYGPGVFPDYLLGKYFQPKGEERIFMFMDIKSATTIAEKLGEEKYFRFLKQFFKDIAPAILFTKAEVYQYVGDEVVITWKKQKGIKSLNCLRCFYAAKLEIKRKKKRYTKTYGVFPEFKVGLHFGRVMTGELGQIKREIAFSGDVVNTAARIQGMCNELENEILLSKSLVKVLKERYASLEVNDLGFHSIKGKADKVNLFTLSDQAVLKIKRKRLTFFKRKGRRGKKG